MFAIPSTPEFFMEYFINKTNKIIVVISKQSTIDDFFLYNINYALRKDPYMIITVVYENAIHTDIPEQIYPIYNNDLEFEKN